ncbi:hypothetical protein J2755_001223 [Methanohalophilus levihalophilus]|nr:hypothetical protein [Methanohalophilus levihalophilus]MBP2030289.1 hypothetical protein [Methanohalophilus levihalophilus]
MDEFDIEAILPFLRSLDKEDITPTKHFQIRHDSRNTSSHFPD